MKPTGRVMYHFSRIDFLRVTVMLVPVRTWRTNNKTSIGNGISKIFTKIRGKLTLDYNELICSGYLPVSGIFFEYLHSLLKKYRKHL